MLLRTLFFVSMFTFSLVAAPNLAQIKAAVSANPSLLNTPQAQAAMAEKGISAADVKAKLNNDSTSNSMEATTETPSNDIDIDVVEESNIENVKKESSHISRVNPFTFETSKKINADLNKKQQRLVKTKLMRYSKKFFTNKNMINPTSLPTPDNYVITNGDTLIIYVYGDRDKKYTPTVNNDGTIELPYLGPINVGGMKFVDAKKHLIEHLKNHFKLSDFYINMKKYSTIQVTLVGDVKAPGLYNLASFSTIKDLLIASKGLNPTASVRNLKIKRNGKVIKNVDFYDLLFKANRISTTILKHGDIVVVDRAKKLASVDGYVNSAAIFELKDGETLSRLIEYAGGMKPNASKTNIKLERYDANAKIKTYTLNYNETKRFHIKDGDKIYIYPLDYAAKESVNIYGNVIRPGAYHLPKNKTLNALLQKNIKNGAKKFFLPRTYFEYAVIKRYNNALSYETKSFNLLDVIRNKIAVDLKPMDEIYIFSQNDIFSNTYVTTKGKMLIKPGKLQYFEGMTIQDAINASGVDGLMDDRVRVTTFYTEDFMPKTKFYSLVEEGDTKLNAYDEVEVFGYYDVHVLEPITIKGEVIKPTTVFYEKGMNLKRLVDMAGGLTHKAYTKNLEIVRYFVDENQTRQRKIIKVDTTKQSYDDIKLQPYDVVNIFKIPNWNENKTITLKGEVKFPGTYTIETGETLTSVIQRAGGFTKEAFIKGAVFTRESVRRNQMDQYNKTLARIKRQLAIYNAMPANSKTGASNDNPLATLNEVMSEAKKYQPIGRVSIKLDENITKIAQSEYDLVLQDKDTLVIPSKIDTVTVFGEVFNPTSFIYHEGMDAEDYINLASGYARGADEERVYIIHADGTSEPAVSGWWIFSSYAQVQKGDTVVVPMYIKEYNQLDLWESVSKIMASFAITVATLNTIGVW